MKPYCKRSKCDVVRKREECKLTACMPNRKRVWAHVFKFNGIE